MEKHYKIQSIIFDKDKWSLENSKKWVLVHGFKLKKVDDKKKTYRFRQLTPSYIKNIGFNKFITKIT